MKYQKILVPYDGSGHAQSAVSTAFSLARDAEDAHVYVVHVAPINVAPDVSPGGAIAGDMTSYLDQDTYAELFDRALASIEAETRDYVVTALDGLDEARVTIEVVSNPSPVRAISDYAESHDCDLIVMGRRGLGALRGMIGSVSFGVLRSVDIPVLTVK